MWNELQARGHFIQPHDYRHANKSELSFEEGRGLVLKCLEIFSNQLAGFEPSETISAFPYNASTPELESWLPGVVRAFRTRGDAINPLPSAQSVKLTAGGSEEAEAWLDHYLRGLMALPEGPGPLRSEYLTRTLERLVALPDLKILPAREILALAKQCTLFTRRIIQLPQRDEDMGAMYLRHVLWSLYKKCGDDRAGWR